jgi:hypothetical protein
MEEGSDGKKGIMEYWNDGMMGKKEKGVMKYRLSAVLGQYSNTPTLHYSRLLALQSLLGHDHA